MQSFLSVRFLIGLSSSADLHAAREHERRLLALDILSEHFPAFTALNGRGYWQGAFEHSMSAEVILNVADYSQGPNPTEAARAHARRVARRIAIDLGQTAVALVFTPVTLELAEPLSGNVEPVDGLPIDLPTSTDLDALAGRYAPLGRGQ